MSLAHRYAAYCVAIKNDFCVEETLAALYAQGVERALIVSPAVYWSDQIRQAPEDFDELQQIAKRTQTAIESVELKGESPIHTEALYRNFAVGKLLSAEPGLDFLITVDSDEFWPPGTLEHLDSIAKGSTRIDLPGIPVIGLPGLPVKDASDLILAATSRELKFTWGRHAPSASVRTGSKPIIHFSATRKTVEEIAAKMRKSAHYGDPSYDFEGWLKNTLPRVKIGSEDVHMYKSEKNIWPRVRAWTSEEKSMIPKSLHSYLA